MVQTPKAQNIEIEGKSNVQLALSAPSVGTVWPFLLQDCGKSDLLELLCKRCEAFMGVLR